MRPDSGITVIIPTKDEAKHVARCVDSARALGRVVVVDCGSADGTQGIARAHGADVVEHAWEGHAAQKNWALDNLALNTEWVLFLDCDEYLPPATAAAIRRAAAAGKHDGYYLPRAYVFLGKELRHAWWYPDHQLRLFRAGRGRFEDRRVHEHAIVEGTTGIIDAPIMHENLKGLAAFIERHNRYSDLEAEELLRPSPRRKPGRLRGSWADRRRALKDRLWFRIPARPLVRFAWMYVVRRGFLDGRRGLLFCALIAMYDLMIDAKLMERRLTPAARSTPQPTETEAADAAA
ncbi:MAG TPA: glycosyltransferase family 2 protein [Candidatus Tectomicrobia bacterium]|nr:glycosyltransferase family 2 protein [Candidatus Tectomicrobia bacterium]